MEYNGSTPKVKVLSRVVLSKSFIDKDKALKAIVDDYVKKTAAFGQLLKEVKIASAALKSALQPKISDKIDLDAGTEWKVVEGDDKGTLIVEVLEKQRPSGTRSRVPTATL